MRHLAFEALKAASTSCNLAIPRVQQIFPVFRSVQSPHSSGLAEVRVNIRTFKVVIALVALAAIVGTREPVQAEPLAVGAPPSLRPAFSEILPMFEREYGAVVSIVYTPSKTLLRQIEKGAPIDVFLSAGDVRDAGVSVEWFRRYASPSGFSPAVTLSMRSGAA